MITLKNYNPHLGQIAFHYAIQNLFRYVAMIVGIRGGKTHAGAREAGRQAWNSKGPGVYGIIAPTYHMLKRTTWREFCIAMTPLIQHNNQSDFIIILKNGREVHGFSADKIDRIRNATLTGFWLDEGRECKDGIWDVLLGRVLSTGGKGILTSSPNSFDWIHRTFVENRHPEYGVIRFPTYQNTYLDQNAIKILEGMYDDKFAQQEIHGQFVIFDGAVYYAFKRNENAGQLALEVATYDPNKPIALCCDFNVDPMAWVLLQLHKKEIYDKEKSETIELKQIRVFDEIFIPNSNTEECCKEFIARYRHHQAGVVLYGDATGKARSANSNLTNWQIIKQMLAPYGISSKVPLNNPAERDRINSVNAQICNSKGYRNIFIHPRCKHLIQDLEQVSYKKGTSQIDKNKDQNLTHPSDGLGYFTNQEFPINRQLIEGLKI